MCRQCAGRSPIAQRPLTDNRFQLWLESVCVSSWNGNKCAVTASRTHYKHTMQEHSLWQFFEYLFYLRSGIEYTFNASAEIVLDVAGRCVCKV